MQQQYVVGYDILPGQNLPQGYCSFSIKVPGENTSPILCKVFNSKGNLLQSLDSSESKPAIPVSIENITEGKLMIQFNFPGDDEKGNTETIDLSAKGGAKLLDQQDFVLTCYEKEGMQVAKRDASIVGDPSPVTYFTGFDVTGLSFFLSYIPWMNTHFVVACPPSQNGQVYLDGLYSCQFNENVVGQSYIDTNSLPVPPGCTIFMISYAYRLLISVRGPMTDILEVQVYENGSLTGTYASRFSGIVENGWYFSTFKHQLLATTTSCTVTISLESSGNLGGVLVMDNLSLNYLTVPVDTSIPTLVYGDGGGNIIGINRTTGLQLWKYATQAEFWADAILIASDIAYVGVGSNPSNVYAINIQTGLLVWKSPQLNGEIDAAPVIAGNYIIVGCSNGYVYGLNKATGTISWNNPLINNTERTATTTNLYVNGTTVDNHGMIYLATDDGVYAENEISQQSIWYYSTPLGVEFAAILTETAVIFADRGGNIICVNKSNGTLVWKKTWASPINCQFYLTGGIAIFGDDGGKLTGMNVADGSVVWTLNFPGAMIRSFTVDGNYIYVSANKLPGTCYCYSYSISDTGVWSFLQQWQSDLPVGAQCAPALDSVNVYFTNADQDLHAFAKFSGTQTWQFASGQIGFATPAIDYPSPTPALSRRYDQCCFLVSHNAYANVDDGWWFAQQTYNIVQQLNMGARALELDIYLQTINGLQQIVYNHEGLANWFMWYKAPWKLLSDSLGEIKTWMDNNPNEIITIIFEQGPGLNNPDPKITAAFTTAGIQNYVFYANKINQGNNSTWNVGTQGWPPLQWLVDNGKRLVVFSQKNRGNTTGFANLWDYAVENEYGYKSLAPGCYNRDESNPLNQNTGKLFVVNYAQNFLSIVEDKLPMSYYISANNYYVLMRKVMCCVNATGNNKWPNLLKINFFEFGAGGGPMEVVTQINNNMPH